MSQLFEWGGQSTGVSAFHKVKYLIKRTWSNSKVKIFPNSFEVSIIILWKDGDTDGNMGTSGVESISFF